MGKVALLAEELRTLRAIANDSDGFSRAALSQDSSDVSALSRYHLIDLTEHGCAMSELGQRFLSLTKLIQDGQPAYLTYEQLQ